jgi:hypothetical protein
LNKEIEMTMRQEQVIRQSTQYTTMWAFKQRVAAIVVMAAGWGWVDGNFVPNDARYFPNALIHCIPIVLLIVLSLRFWQANDGRPSVEAGTGMSIFAGASLLATFVLIIFGMTNADPNSVGVHNLADWFPAILLDIGTLPWLTSLLPVGRPQHPYDDSSSA